MRFTVQTAVRYARILALGLDPSTVNAKKIGNNMNMKLAISCLFAGTLMLPLTSYAADSGNSSTTEFVKDSVITAQVKTELAEKKLSTLTHISVDTDKSGMVVLSGTAPSKDAVNKAVSIARAVKGVTSVENHIQIAAD
jgi:hyperosmotically inducible protein